MNIQYPIFLGILPGGLERHKYYIETLHTLFIETCGIYGACVTQTILMCNNSKLRANYLLKQSEKEKWQKIKSYLLSDNSVFTTSTISGKQRTSWREHQPPPSSARSIDYLSGVTTLTPSKVTVREKTPLARSAHSGFDGGLGPSAPLVMLL